MARGTLRIYLGAAPGVGKTFAMLGEGRRRAERGTDVVVGYRRDARPDEDRRRRSATSRSCRASRSTTAARRSRRWTSTRSSPRRPEVALVDELAHTNVPGSRNEKRWQDVEELLDAGITVISTLNIQHLESRQRRRRADHRRQAAGDDPRRGRPPRRPDRARRHGAGGDPPPHGAREHLSRRADRRRARQLLPHRATSARCASWRSSGSPTASTRRSQDYRERHGIERPWETRERVLVALTGSADGERLVRRAARMAARAKGDLLAVHVRPQDGLAGGAAEMLDRQRELVEELGGTYREVVGADVGEALVSAARSLNATQIVLGATRRSRFAELTRGSVINRVIRDSGVGLDVHVISRADGESGATASRTRRPGALPRRRVRLGFLLGAVGLPLLTWALTNLRAHLGLPSVLLLFLLLVVGRLRRRRRLARARRGRGRLPPRQLVLHAARSTRSRSRRARTCSPCRSSSPWLQSSAASSRSPPAARPRSASPRRGRGARRSRGQRAGACPAGRPPARSRARAVAVFHAGRRALGRRPRRRAAPCPTAPRRRQVELDDCHVLVVVGRAVETGDDNRILDAFAREIAASLALEQLEAEASEAGTLAAAGELRTAILSAVSHDLRTPLVGDQGVGHEPAAGGRRVDAGGAARVPRHDRRGDGPAQRPRRQPARHEPAADGSARRQPDRRRGRRGDPGSSRKPRCPCRPTSTSTSTRRFRACSPTRDCSSGRSRT